MKKVFIGSDVSKGYMDLHITDNLGEILIDNKKFVDNRKGHESLFKLLSKLKESGHEEIHIALESTGGYENNWVRSLIEMTNVFTYRLNPIRTHYQGKLEMVRTESDSVSAMLICNHLLTNYKKLKAVGEDSEEFTNYRKIYNDILTTQKQRIQLSNQLNQLIYNLMPEMQRYIKEKIPNWLLDLLILYPSSLKIQRARAKTISNIKGITIEKAKEIQSVLKNGIGLQEDTTMEYLIVKNSKKIKNLIADEKATKKFLETVFEHSQKGSLVKIGGIGSYTESAILLEIEDISRFDSAKKMVSFFGVHPNHKESGDKQTKSRMSKRGSTSYRSIIFMAAKNVVMNDPTFKEIYEKLKTTGKNYMEIMGIIMHKLTRVIYGILKNKEAYDPMKILPKKREIDKQNKLQKAIIKRAIIDKEIKELLNSPCSKTKLRKKKKELESQDKLIAECGII